MLPVEPKPVISASAGAARAHAPATSNTTAPAPSPATNRAATSNGGVCQRRILGFDSAPRFREPAGQMGDTDSSEPPASADVDVAVADVAQGPRRWSARRVAQAVTTFRHSPRSP